MSLSKVSNSSIAALAALRMAAGAATFLAPSHAAPLFGIALTPGTTILARLFGTRDFLIGAYLWKARQQYTLNASEDKTGNLINAVQREETKRELKRMLWMGIFADALDVGACLVGWLDGSMQLHALVGVGVGAAIFVEMGLIGLNGFRIKV